MVFNDVKWYYRFYITDQWKLKDVQIATTTRNLRCLSSFSAMVQRSWGQWLRRRSSLPKLNQVDWHLKCTEQREEESRRGWLSLKDLKYSKVGSSNRQIKGLVLSWFQPSALSVEVCGKHDLSSRAPDFPSTKLILIYFVLGPHEMLLYHCPGRCPDI